MPSSALTKNQTLVLRTLSNASGPLSAYAILDLLRDDGVRAPPQVYRALNSLVERGLAHRLESLNAFVACAHADHGHTHAPGEAPGAPHSVGFAICVECGQVSEFVEPVLSQRLAGWSEQHRFRLKSACVELRGVCAACDAAGGGSGQAEASPKSPHRSPRM